MAGLKKRFMANIPGATNVLPGVYGPSGTEIVKTEKGYAIGWNGVKSKFWGEPFIEGTTREIARDIITNYGKALDRSDELNPPDFYLSIRIQWKPDVVCTLLNSARIREFEAKEFLKELAAELRPLAKLLPFV